MLGFCTDPKIISDAHCTIEVDGVECIVLACKHTADEAPDSSKDHFIYRAPDGSCILIVYDVNGEVIQHHKWAEDLFQFS